MKVKKIKFPADETASIKKRLVENKKIITLRVSREHGKYKKGDLLQTGWGDVLRVVKKKTLVDVKKYKYIEELTQAQIAQLKKYKLIDIIYLKKINLNPFTYIDEKNKKHTIKVKPVPVLSTGLMFRKNSLPLLFDLGRVQPFSIHSLFCRSFRAIWLDGKKKVMKVVDVKPWKLNLRGVGRYLLEVPLEK